MMNFFSISTLIDLRAVSSDTCALAAIFLIDGQQAPVVPVAFFSLTNQHRAIKTQKGLGSISSPLANSVSMKL